MNAYRSTLENFNGPSFLVPADSKFGFGLIRHTKQNPNRLRTFARTNLTWIGSVDNYHARIKRRWPIRFFLAHTLPEAFAVWPLERIQLKIQRAKRLRLLSSEQIALEEALRETIGIIPSSRGEVFAKLTAALPEHPDLVRRVDVSYGLSHGLLLRLKHERQDAVDKLHARPGQGTKFINEYPEADWINTLQMEIDRVLRRIARDAKELAILIPQ